MTKQTINRGGAANDGTGDNLRAGAAKVNENFDELYTVLGDGTTLQPGDYITTSSTSIITNKTIDGSSNTITNIPNSALSSIDNAKLTNSNITITGDGAQTSAVDLGDTLTIEGGTGITTSVTADKVSISIDGAVLTEDSSDVLTNKTISGSTNTLSSIANTSLTNSTVSYGGVQLNLGGVDATPAFDLADATNYPTSSLSGTITNAQLDGSIANDKLTNNKIVLVDDTSATQDINLGANLEIAGGTGITTASSPNKITINVSGVANSSLANDSVTIGSTSLALGNTLSGTTATFTGDVTALTSDIRLKTNIEPIENALDKVLGINGFTYNHNEIAGELGLDTEIRYAGVSAQDLQEVLPEAVKPCPASDEYLTVQYEKVVPLLIEAIKELKSEIEELKK